MSASLLGGSSINAPPPPAPPRSESLLFSERLQRRRTTVDIPPNIQMSRRRRLLDRDGPVAQSSGRWKLKHNWTTTGASGMGVFGEARRQLRMADPFHTVVNFSTWKIIVGACIVYTIAVLFFAVPYWLIGQRGWCAMVDHAEHIHHKQNMNFLDAVFFSVETMATIGYGAPTDIFFDDCTGMAALIISQNIFSLLMDSVVLGIVFNRMARGTPRAASIVFSDKAVLRQLEVPRRTPPSLLPLHFSPPR